MERRCSLSMPWMVLGKLVMQITFSTNSTNNQTYTFNSVTWVYAGSRCEVQASGSDSGATGATSIQGNIVPLVPIDLP